MFHIVIPARFGSTRLPAKALADINGKPLVYWVWRRALESKAASVTIATDDERIVSAMKPHGANVQMTRVDHASGTDRIAEVAAVNAWDDGTVVVNLQGDEPLMPVANLHQVADLLNQHANASIATLCERVTSTSEYRDPSVVKLVADASGRALYFSRAAIPHGRDSNANEVPPEAMRHIGLYAYRARYLGEFTKASVAPFERLESLEQLRALHLGHEIRVEEALEPVPAGVDTQTDLDAVRAIMAQK